MYVNVYVKIELARLGDQVGVGGKLGGWQRQVWRGRLYDHEWESNDKFREAAETRGIGNVATGRMEPPDGEWNPELMGRRPQFAIRLRDNTCVWRFDYNDGIREIESEMF